jgi:gas vesicle protein
MNILDNRLLGIILGILLIIVFFFIKKKNVEGFGLWEGLMNTGFRLLLTPIRLVMSLLGNMASKEVGNVTRDAKSMATNALSTVSRMATTAINKTKTAVTDVTNKVQKTVTTIADDTMKKVQATIQKVVSQIRTFIRELMKEVQRFFTITIVSTLKQATSKAKEIWNYIVNSTYGKIKNFIARIKIYIMRFINYYIAKAKPYTLYIAIATGIIAVGGIGSYVYFNFFHDPNAKSSNNNNTPVNNTPVNNTPIANDVPQTIPQTVE